MAENTPTLPRLGGYTLLSMIAHGGMAEVYLAQQEGVQGFKKIVVIKRILPHLAKEPDFVRMFLDEARLAALINHPNVVSIYELGEEPITGAYFMAMEYIDGRNLREVADVARSQKRKLEPRLVARLVADACAGLHFAHELAKPSGEALQIVHRDVSPENLLVTYGGLVKIVDFGIAKAAQNESLTKTGQVKGKLSYLAPEQLQAGRVDRRSDIWSLGVTLYWLLTGEKPFKGQGEAQIMRAVLDQKPAPLAKRGRDTLEPFQAIVDKALAKNPIERYSTAAAMQEDLERILLQADRPVTAATVAATMEKLFPKDSDPDRLRHRQILSRPDAKTEEPSIEISLSESAALVEELAVPKSRLGLRVALIAIAGLLAVVVAKPSLLSGLPRRLHGGKLDRLAVSGGAPRSGSANTPEATSGAGGSPTVPVAPVIDAGSAPWRLMSGAALPDAGRVLSDAGPSPALQVDAGAAMAQAAPPPAPPVTMTVPPVALPLHEPAPVHAAAHEVGHARPAHAAVPFGTLQIQGRPGLSVYIDGRRMGATPFPPLRALPGRHKVELVEPHTPKSERRFSYVEIRVGQTTVFGSDKGAHK